MAFYMKRGATRPSYAVQLLQDFNRPTQRPIDVSSTSGLTSIVFVMAPNGDGEAIKKPAVVMYPDVGLGHPEFATKGGWVRYDWVSDDTSFAGEFRAEFDLMWGTQVETIPNEGYLSIVIQKDLG